LNEVTKGQSNPQQGAVHTITAIQIGLAGAMNALSQKDHELLSGRDHLADQVVGT
jgi:hypothetical protein